MPSQFTHALIAEEAYSALPDNVRAEVSSLSDYYAGAHGGDIFFFLRLTADAAENVGKSLHRQKIYRSFCALLAAAREGGAELRSYAAGYIAHYAADIVFHPFVYGTQERLAAAADGGEKALRRVGLHSYIESDLDTHFVRTRRGVPVNLYTPPAHSAAAEKLYPAVREAYGGKPFTVRAFRRSFRRFKAYERFFSDRTFRKRKLFYAAESVLHAPHALSSLCRRKDADPRCINSDRALWRNPSVPQQTSHESADELFGRAVAEAVRLICAFFIALQGNGALSEADFSRSFLTAADESVPLVRPSQAKRRREKSARKKR